MKRLLFSTLILSTCALSAPKLNAQVTPNAAHANCGTDHQTNVDIKSRMFKNRDMRARLMREYDARNTSDTIYIPIIAHLTADNAGNGRFSEIRFLQNICQTNEYYASQKVKFYLKEGKFRYIDNNILYDHGNRTTAGYLMGLYKEEGGINMFVTQGAGDLPNGGTAGGYYTSGLDVIVLSKGNLNRALSTMAHEIGHLLTLPHPFLGWQQEGYDPAKHTPTPVVNPLTGDYVENQARTGNDANCLVAGDGFCGTYPNYYFGPGSGCTYTGSATDPKGVAVTPDEDNIMSYFPELCVSDFSADQEQAMLLDIISRRYDSLAPAEVKYVSGPASLVAPINNKFEPYFQNVRFEWAAAPNASRYLVSIFRGPAAARTFYKSFYMEGTTDGSNITVDLQLDPNQSYYWEVFPYTPTDICYSNGRVASGEFRTGDWAVSTTEIASIQSSNVYPNPNSTGQLAIEINSSKADEANIVIYDALGRQVMQPQQVQLQSGQNIENISIQDLPSGMYIVGIESAEGRISHKLMVD